MKKEKKIDSGARHSSRTRVLFVCVGNACRSPMAEAIARYDAADVIEPASAGLTPLGFIAEQTKQILVQNGYSANGLTSDAFTREAAEDADIIINMTGNSSHGAFWKRKRVEDWMVEDPYSKDSATYQRVLEGIRRRVNQLAEALRVKRENRTASR